MAIQLSPYASEELANMDRQRHHFNGISKPSEAVDVLTHIIDIAERIRCDIVAPILKKKKYPTTPLR